MAPHPVHHSFPIMPALLALSLTMVALGGASWALLPTIFGDEPTLAVSLATSFGVVWITGIVGLALVGLLGPLGVLPTVYAFFAGMALRMILSVGTAMLFFHKGLVAGKPLAVSLAIAYLPALAIEAAFVARYLWQKDALTPSASDDAGIGREVTA